MDEQTIIQSNLY